MFALRIDPGSICEAVWENPSDDSVAKFGQIDEYFGFLLGILLLLPGAYLPYHKYGALK